MQRNGTSPSGRTILCYGPCGAYFGSFHIDGELPGNDNYFEVRCRNKRCLRDGYVTYHKWDLALGGCSTDYVPKQYDDPRDNPGVMSLVKGN